MALELVVSLLLLQNVMVEVRYGTGSRDPIPNAEVTMWRDGQPQDPPRRTNGRGQVRFAPINCAQDEEIRFQARLRTGGNPTSARRNCQQPKVALKIYP